MAQTSLGMLAWVEAGSLWLRELPDGRAAKIASAEGLHAPRISSSGRWISYQDRDDNLFVVRNDGQAGHAIDGDACAWLPREDRLAIEQEDGIELIAPETASKTHAAQWKGCELGVFAPDGQQFVFARDLEDDAQLCLVSLNSPERAPEVLVSVKGALQPCAWSADGQTIIYWRAGERSASIWSDGVPLECIALGGGQPRTFGVLTLVHEDMVDVAPKSGKQIAATRGAGRQTWSEQRIVLMNVETGAVRNVTADNIAALSPAWSPDGRRIAYVAARDASTVYKSAMAGANIRVLRTDGTTQTKVVTPDMHLSPGGGEEAHVFLHQRKIWVVDPNSTGAPRQLTADPQYRDEEPMWSTGGGHILFGRMDYEGHASLWLMESSGNGAAQMCKLQILDPMGGAGSWFGYYGYTNWRDSFDWRRIG